jgi:hypothetical protein
MALTKAVHSSSTLTGAYTTPYITSPIHYTLDYRLHAFASIVYCIHYTHAMCLRVCCVAVQMRAAQSASKSGTDAS